MNQKTINYSRYHRQIILNEFGKEGQQKLLQSNVLVVGAGGLGCAALQYLTAAGIGTIGIVDDDVVSLDNLHRQILYSVEDIGLMKASQAKEKLKRLNPEIQINAFNERLTVSNALSIFSNYDIIIDCTDNFASRYLINDACVLLHKPMVYGAVSQYEGQLAIFNYQDANIGDSVNYRDLFPIPPKDDVLNCEEAGVLGVLPGIIGVMQAGEAIKLIVGLGKSMVNTLLSYNYLTNQFYEISLTPNKSSRLLIPANEDSFRQMNYEWLCSTKNNELEIDAAQFDQFIKSNTATLVDVREPWELPIIQEIEHLKIPLSQIKERTKEINRDTIILFCQSGKRSLIAAQQLSVIFGSSKMILSLKGGINSWLLKNRVHS